MYELSDGSAQTSRLLLTSMHTMRTLICSEHDEKKSEDKKDNNNTSSSSSSSSSYSEKDNKTTSKPMNKKGSIPLQDRTTLASLLLALHHLLQPRDRTQLYSDSFNASPSKATTSRAHPASRDTTPGVF
jgi:hypothetical protein